MATKLVEYDIRSAVPAPAAAEDAVEVSVVMPCLNEADTLEVCITKAQRALREHHVRGEIIVADNGSTDGSQAIARRMGARVVDVQARGYGNALKGGIAAARGTFVVMGDADDSYDFLEIPKFVEKLREGYDLVQGCRLPSGGGTIRPGAMPTLHRWWGNPCSPPWCAACSGRRCTTSIAGCARSEGTSSTASICVPQAWSSRRRW
jgi:glycosyltransferase involved in cell wall biosynthesis